MAAPASPAQQPGTRLQSQPGGADQAPGGGSPEERLAAYLERPFFTEAPWVQDWEEARKLAKDGNRLILGYFTYSFTDSPGSKMVEEGVFLEPGFQEFGARGPVLFVHVMARIKGRENDDMRRTARSRRLPALVYFDADGTFLHKQPVPRPDQLAVADLWAHRDALWVIARKQQAEAGGEDVDPPTPAALLHAELVLRRLDFPTAEKRFAGLGKVPEDLLEKMQPLLHRLELDHLSIRFRTEGIDAVGPEYVAMLDEGRAPTDNSNESFGYWSNLTTYALHSGDLRLAHRGLEGLRQAAKDRPLLQDALKRFEERVQKTRGGGR